MVTGQLGQPFSVRDLQGDEHEAAETANLAPGDPYPGRADATNGEYRVLQKRGGVIERSLGGGVREFALTSGDAEQIANALSVLDAWRRLSTSGLKIAVNASWDAWYLDGGEPRFLAAVPGGFAWPSLPAEVD